MYVGDEPQQLTYTVLDGDTIAGLVWESSNPDVAVVDKNGRVTAVAPGEATYHGHQCGRRLWFLRGICSDAESG